MGKQVSITLIDRGERVNPEQRYRVKSIMNGTFVTVGQVLSKNIVDDLLSKTSADITFEAYEEKRE